MVALHETASGISFAVKVQPRARKSAITGELGNAIKLSITAPPVDGRANEACVEFFAELFSIPRTAVIIASGQSSRNKIIRIVGIPRETLLQKLQHK